ncbi:MAG: DUF3592 domain-containing protein [Planctomycetes bacterium]|nr:DUF3592 domain-containing protein [Planctomycetota bacterium]MCB9904988.1 DUF3592 domain-containing protein [Planctomycetota bacterium]
MTEGSDPKQRSKTGKAYSIFWFLLALFTYRGCAVSALEREELRDSWQLAEATVVSNRVGYGGLDDDRYYLHAVFAVGEGAEAKTSDEQVASGSLPYVERQAAGDYAPGTRHEVFVNPANPGQLMFPEDVGRQYWVGVGGAALFAVFGLSVLFARSRRPDSDPGQSPARP